MYIFFSKPVNTNIPPSKPGAAMKQGHKCTHTTFTSLPQKMMGYIPPTGISSDEQTSQILQTSTKCRLPPPLQKCFQHFASLFFPCGFAACARAIPARMQDLMGQQQQLTGL